ncbi:MaoC family dehydratase [Nocardioides carbamazepini]|uniref:MaoC family dehydratase n=1 Tax=Nocardioides carbamazepini TaxID=2854259 RepID=UPI002149F828|nr:MaoC family dehydratase [Nocardioides carbamazepini]MCR1785574.1 MaoC family dehydratase [Nocardioides carbamazepini]
MGARVIATAEELNGLLGQQLGVTDWLTVDQERVDGFAKVTDDHQWIHVDTERAKQSPFGGTIAHGFLTLALTVPLGAELYELGFGSSRLNYGLNKVRFPAPVPVGSRIRAQVTLDEIRETGAGLQLTTTYTIEIEGKERPACVAERLTLVTP